MKNTIKKAIGIRLGVMIIVFLAAVIFFGKFTDEGNQGLVADLDAATYPEVSFGYQGYKVNYLPAYASEMEISAVRDTITPAANQMIELHIDAHDSKITSIDAEVLTLDGKESLYQTTVKEPEEQVDLEFPDPALLETEHALKLTLHLGEQKSVYYYTRILSDAGTSLVNCLDYVGEFHDYAIEKAENVGIGKAIEPNEYGDPYSLRHVTIHSDYNHVTYGSLQPKPIGAERWSIKELNKTSCSVELDFDIRCVGEENTSDVYKTKEFFRVRYAKGVMALLDYDRVMEQRFDPYATVLNSKGLILGVTEPGVSYLANKEEDVIAFIQAGEIWSYNRTDGTMSSVFTFASAESKDRRNQRDDYRLKLLSMEKNGNLTFAVVGYMNRGNHEGEVGAAVYYYSVKDNSVEEKAFISSNKSAGHAQLELGNLIYYSTKRDMLYAVVEHALCEFDVKKQNLFSVAQNLQEEDYVMSEDAHLVAYKTDGLGLDGKDVQVMNLKTGEATTVECKKGETLRPMGFIQDDFVCGVIAGETRGALPTGEEVEAVSRLEIISPAGELLKTYEEEGIFLLGASITGNMITMNRATLADGVFETIPDDYISNNEGEKESVITEKVYVSSLKETQVLLAFEGGVAKKDVLPLNPQYTLQVSAYAYTSDDAQDQTKYYVYGHGSLQGIYNKAGEAIAAADALSGVVVSPNQAYVWERGNRDLKYQIEDLTDVEMIRSRMAAGEAPLDILKELRAGAVVDLTGCTPEQLMYILNHNRPVVAMKDASQGVILVGYTEGSVTYVDIATGEKQSMSLKELSEYTAQSGGAYIG